MRPSGRAPDALRPVSLEPGFAKYAEGSCLARFGDTHVLCTASVEERVPPFLRNTGRGWVTAEYGMLPRSTHTRTDREAARGRQSGRTQEIQRLIGRSLRAVTDLAALGERQIRIDCDVLQADGGTRTAAITGSYVALYQALAKLVAAGSLASVPLNDSVAAVSCGVFDGVAVLDLDYAEDSQAMTDANFVLTGSGGIVEIQATAEGAPFDEADVRRNAGTGARRHRRIGRAAARRSGVGLSDGEADRGRRASGRRQPQFRQGRRDRGIAEAVRGRDGRCGGARPARAGGDRRDIRGKRRAEGARRRREKRVAGAVRRFRAGRAGAGRRAGDLLRRAGPGRARISAPRWSGCGASLSDMGRDRSAHFVAVLALAWPDGEIATFRGEVHGRLVWPPRGERGFGYDPIFVPDGYEMTFGEIDPDEKHRISHRARAFEKLVRECF